VNDPELFEKKILNDEEFPVQLQHNFCRGETEIYFYNHWHEHVELHYVTRGRAKYQLNYQDYEAGPGTLIIANSGELHSGTMLDPAFEEYALIFSVEALSKELGEKNLVYNRAIPFDPVIDGLIREIFEEDKKKDFGYKQSNKARVLGLLVYLSRKYVVQALTKADSLRRKQQMERLNQVIVYIESHYIEPVDNQKLADMVYLSKDRFEHLFREHIGMAPLQYINDFRLKKAMRLIKSSQLSITEIATAVGFQDYNHFGRLFRKCYGCTPTQAKKQFETAESYD